MSKRQPRQTPPPPPPHQDSPTPPREEGRGESHALPDPSQTPPPSEAPFQTLSQRRVVALAEDGLALLKSAPHDAEMLAQAEARVATAKAMGPEEARAFLGASAPGGAAEALIEAHQRELEQAGSFGPLPGIVVVDEVADLTDEQRALLRRGAAGAVYAAAPDAKAVLATGVGTDSPAATDLLLEPVASSPNVARAYREEQLALQAEAAQQAAAAEAALAALNHLKDTQGLALRREPDESGSPRFTLLGLRVEAGGQASVEVLVPVAPWHHIHDFIERYLRTTLTPREYQ